MNRIAAVHQPNFFPWLGYFNKIARADVFVVLDDAQLQKTGSTWSNRVKLLFGDQAKWATAPIARPAHGTVTLGEAKWAQESPWRAKLAKSLHLHYRRAPFFAEAMELLEPLVLNPEPGLTPYNVHAVRTIAGALGLPDNFVLSSTLGATATGTERLVQLVRAAGCHTYLAGGGAGGYQEDAVFEGAGLALEYQAFTHPTYPQDGATAFRPGMSIIDVLMNCGVSRTRGLVVS